MTRPGSSGAEEAWTSGQAAPRRKALSAAGMERPVAERLVDVLDEQAAPRVTRAEADAPIRGEARQWWTRLWVR